MPDLMEKIISLAKRRGFVFQNSEIYGGLAGTYDLGPYGSELAYNLKDLWWRRFVRSRDDMYALSSAIIMPEKVWQASGHLKNFTDPMVECDQCRKRYRADHLIEADLAAGRCPACGGRLGEAKTFNLMFPIETGLTDGGQTTAYLRGELAQGMFVNFKNVLDTYQPALPFGIAQIGRAFRNEISPRDWLYRAREFEIAEFEYFVAEADWEKRFEYWRMEMVDWLSDIGIDPKQVKQNDLPASDRAHYSKRTIDFEYQGPIGDMEIQAIAYRGDYDLKNHMNGSGTNLTYHDEKTGQKFLPHVIEPTFGVGRTLLAVLLSAYTEDDLGGEPRVYLKLKPKVAPVRLAVFPLLKNKPALVTKAKSVYQDLKQQFGAVAFDDHGNIGKRYRRQDEIGTPYCLTIDFKTLDNDTVTIRDRDSGRQERVAVGELKQFLAAKF